MTDNEQKLLRRIDEKLSRLLIKEAKPVWGRVNWVQELTGWNGDQIRNAREQGLIEFRATQSEKILEYRLDSIPPIFIINKKAPTAVTVNA